MMNIYKSLTEDDGQSAGVLKNLLEEPDMDKLLNNPFKITAGDVKVSTLRKNKRGLNVFYRHFGNFVVEQSRISWGNCFSKREREQLESFTNILRTQKLILSLTCSFTRCDLVCAAVYDSQVDEVVLYSKQEDDNNFLSDINNNFQQRKRKKILLLTIYNLKND